MVRLRLYGSPVIIRGQGRTRLHCRAVRYIVGADNLRIHFRLAQGEIILIAQKLSRGNQGNLRQSQHRLRGLQGYGILPLIEIKHIVSQGVAVRRINICNRRSLSLHLRGSSLVAVGIHKPILVVIHPKAVDGDILTIIKW